MCWIKKITKKKNIFIFETKCLARDYYVTSERRTNPFWRKNKFFSRSHIFIQAILLLRTGCTVEKLRFHCMVSFACVNILIMIFMVIEWMNKLVSTCEFFSHARARTFELIATYWRYYFYGLHRFFFSFFCLLASEFSMHVLVCGLPEFYFFFELRVKYELLRATCKNRLYFFLSLQFYSRFDNAWRIHRSFHRLPEKNKSLRQEHREREDENECRNLNRYIGVRICYQHYILFLLAGWLLVLSWVSARVRLTSILYPIMVSCALCSFDTVEILTYKKSIA